jgi:hypothetical protein
LPSASQHLIGVLGLEVSASADSRRVRLQTGAMKKHDLQINPLRLLNCSVEGNSSSELYESDPREGFSRIVLAVGPAAGNRCR